MVLFAYAVACASTTGRPIYQRTVRWRILPLASGPPPVWARERQIHSVAMTWQDWDAGGNVRQSGCRRLWRVPIASQDCPYNICQDDGGLQKPDRSPGLRRDQTAGRLRPFLKPP